MIHVYSQTIKATDEKNRSSISPHGAVGKSVQNVKKRQKMPLFKLQGGRGRVRGDWMLKLFPFQDTSKDRALPSKHWRGWR